MKKSTGSPLDDLSSRQQQELHLKQLKGEIDKQLKLVASVLQGHLQQNVDDPELLKNML